MRFQRTPPRPISTSDGPRAAEPNAARAARETGGSKYITAAGAARLRAELEQLWRHERPLVTAQVAAAAAQGDRSENAEYTYGKRRLREIDRRVRFLRSRLDRMKIVDRPPTDRSRIYFGARVTLEEAGGERVRYRIVGPDELDMGPDYISMDAPLGRALLGKSLDAEVEIALAAVLRRYTVLAIEYPDLADIGDIGK
jgi:transcription elongation factor GreB